MLAIALLVVRSVSESFSYARLQLHVNGAC